MQALCVCVCVCACARQVLHSSHLAPRPAFFKECWDTEVVAGRASFHSVARIESDSILGYNQRGVIAIVHPLTNR